MITEAQAMSVGKRELTLTAEKKNKWLWCVEACLYYDKLSSKEVVRGMAMQIQ